MSDGFAPMRQAPDGFFRSGDDSRMFVKFHLVSRRNGFKSDQEGRPIYEPVDYVMIQQPGERDQLDRPVQEFDKQRWPHLWKAYQEKAEQKITGTPVQMLFPNEPHIVELLLDLKIDTLEQLAQLSEHAIERLGMDGRNYVERARSALNKAAQASEVTRLSRLLDDALEQVRTYKAANDGLAERVKALEVALRPAAAPVMVPEPESVPTLPLRGRQRAEEPPPERRQLVG